MDKKNLIDVEITEKAIISEYNAGELRLINLKQSLENMAGYKLAKNSFKEINNEIFEELIEEYEKIIQSKAKKLKENKKKFKNNYKEYLNDKNKEMNEFEKELFKAISKADEKQLNELYQSYPNLVEAIAETKGIKHLINKKDNTPVNKKENRYNQIKASLFDINEKLKANKKNEMNLSDKEVNQLKNKRIYNQKSIRTNKRLDEHILELDKKIQKTDDPAKKKKLRDQKQRIQFKQDQLLQVTLNKNKEKIVKEKKMINRNQMTR